MLGNKIEETYLNSDNKACINEVNGISRIIYKYNKSGTILQVKAYNILGIEIKNLQPAILY